MKEIKPPDFNFPTENTLFLAGSIDMGQAIDWQKQVKELLKDSDWTILNPRRDDWDNSWVQDTDNPKFKEQVEWELQAQEHATKILMFLDPQGKSPISLLELGLFAKSGKIIVVCPKGFWRKGNVDIVCERYKIPLYENLEKAVQENLIKN